MKVGRICQTGIGVFMATIVLMISTPAVFADEVNPGVFAIDSQPYGLTYGQWSEKWWQWALSQTALDNCPNESGPVWFLTAPTQSNCVIPANRAIMFPTFNVEWSAAEAQLQASTTPGQTCLVPTHPNGTTYAALLACARAQANNVTEQEDNATATLDATVDGRTLHSLEEYRAHSKRPPFTFTAVSGNLFGVPTGTSQSVADGFWIMLEPLSSGKHRLHFSATVPFPNVNPPGTPFTFTTEADYCLIVQPSNQVCP
jgi:hypothetical protein